MDTQATYMYQRNRNESSSTGRQQPGNAGNGNNTNGNDPRKKGASSLRVFLFIIAILAVLAAGDLFSSSQAPDMQNQPVGELPYSSFYQQVMDGNVDSATFQGQDITGQFRNAISLMDSQGNAVLTKQYHLTQIPNGDPNLIPLLTKYHVGYQAKPVSANNGFLVVLLNFLPLILVFGFFFIARRSIQSQQNIFSFGKTRAEVVPGDRPDSTFANVAAVD